MCLLLEGGDTWGPSTKLSASRSAAFNYATGCGYGVFLLVFLHKSIRFARRTPVTLGAIVAWSHQFCPARLFLSRPGPAAPVHIFLDRGDQAVVGPGQTDVRARKPVRSVPTLGLQPYLLRRSLDIFGPSKPTPNTFLEGTTGALGQYKSPLQGTQTHEASVHSDLMPVSNLNSH